MPQNDSFIFFNSVIAGSVVIGVAYFIVYLEIFPQLFGKEYLNGKFIEINLFKFSIFKNLKSYIKLNNFFLY
jgi:hypothetical protein